MYWIFHSRQHALLLKDEHDEAEPVIVSPERCGSMLALAIERLIAHGLPAERVICATYFTAGELAEADEPGDLFLPAHAVIEAARLELPLNEDDLSTDDDAVLSGWNVQSWQTVSPESVVEWMLQAGPVPRYRPFPDREQALAARHQERLDAVADQLRSVIDPSQDLSPYLVLYREAGADLVFACQAEDPDHAREQAVDANPGVEILATLPLAPSVRDNLLQALVMAGDDAAALYLQKTAAEPA